MPPHRLLMQKAYDTRIPLPHIRHFERKREIFFVRGKTKAVRGTASGKHPAPCAPKKRCFMQTAPRRKKNTANEKDPSVALGMTIRECLFPTHDFHPAAMPTSAPSGHLLPWEGGRMPLPLSSFRAKARNLFRSRSKKDVRGAGNGKPSAPCAPKKRCFMQENEGKKHLKQAIRQTKSPAFRRSFFIGSIVPEPR